jgi:hypothetical protein
MANTSGHLEGESWDSSFGIETSFGLDDLGSIPDSTESRPALGPTHSPIQCIPGALPPGVERSGREADHSPPSNAEVKNACVTLCLHPPIRLHGVMFS